MSGPYLDVPLVNPSASELKSNLTQFIHSEIDPKPTSEIVYENHPIKSLQPYVDSETDDDFRIDRERTEQQGTSLPVGVETLVGSDADVMVYSDHDSELDLRVEDDLGNCPPEDFETLAHYRDRWERAREAPQQKMENQKPT